ncbi:Rv1733c family protein [Nocardia sp. NPDC003963]
MSESVSDANIRWSTLSRGWALRPSNPNTLMRPGDRLEAIVRIVAVLVVLALIPIAGVAGTGVYTRATADIAVEQRTRSTVSAAVVEKPTTVGWDVARAKVVWVAAGRDRAATVPVPVTSHIGDRIELWVDGHGDKVAPPRPRSAAATNGVVVGCAVVFYGAVATWCAAAAVSRVLSQRRNEQWEREWRAFDGTTGRMP